MWAFLQEVLRTHGLAALVMVAALGACGYAIFHLWKQNQALNDKLKSAADEHAAKLEGVKKAHEQAMASLAKDHTEQLALLASQHAARMDELARKFAEQTDVLSGRIDELQERRVTDTLETSKKITEYILHFDRFAMKLEAALDVLLNASRGGSR